MEQQAQALLHADNLVAGYQTPITAPLSFALYAGDILGICGANGAGKSTVIRAIMGTARIFSGLLHKAAGIRIVHQAQRPVQLKQMPLLGAELLRLCGTQTTDVPHHVQPLLHQRLDKLSGGQLQLLQTWACLGSGADVIVLDEPTNNLDPTGIATLSEGLQQLQAHQAVLVVSHEANFVQHVCTRTQDLHRA